GGGRCRGTTRRPIRAATLARVARAVCSASRTRAGPPAARRRRARATQHKERGLRPPRRASIAPSLTHRELLKRRLFEDVGVGERPLFARTRRRERVTQRITGSLVRGVPGCVDVPKRVAFGALERLLREVVQVRVRERLFVVDPVDELRTVEGRIHELIEIVRREPRDGRTDLVWA